MGYPVDVHAITPHMFVQLADDQTMRDQANTHKPVKSPWVVSTATWKP